MQLKRKVLSPLQLQFLAIICEMCGIMAGRFGLRGIYYFFQFNFILTCIVLGISGGLFIGIIVSEEFSGSEKLRKLEWLFHVTAGSLMFVAALVWLVMDPCATIFCGYFTPRIAFTLIGLLLNGPLHLVIGAQLYTTKRGRHEPLYWLCSIFRSHPLQGQEVHGQQTGTITGAGLLDSCYSVEDPRYQVPSLKNSSPTFMAQQVQKYTECSPLREIMHSV